MNPEFSVDAAVAHAGDADLYESGDVMASPPRAMPLDHPDLALVPGSVPGPHYDDSPKIFFGDSDAALDGDAEW